MPHKPWDAPDIEKLVRHVVGGADKDSLLEIFPNRPWGGIQWQLRNLGIRMPEHLKVEPMIERKRKEDMVNLPKHKDGRKVSYA